MYICLEDGIGGRPRARVLVPRRRTSAWRRQAKIGTRRGEGLDVMRKGPGWDACEQQYHGVVRARSGGHAGRRTLGGRRRTTFGSDDDGAWEAAAGHREDVGARAHWL